MKCCCAHQNLRNSQTNSSPLDRMSDRAVDTSSGIFIPERVDGQSSIGETRSERTLWLAELRKFPIPECLINAVEQFASDAPVYWITRDGLPPRTNPDEMIRWISTTGNEQGADEADYGAAHWPDEDIPPAKEGAARPLVRRADTLTQAGDFPYDETFQPDNYPRTAGEALAMCLTEWLWLLREVPEAPVRVGGLLSKSAISQVALFLLCDGKPGIYLELLFLVLLDLDRPKLSSSKQGAARYEAAWIVAQSDLGPRCRSYRDRVYQLDHPFRDQRFQESVVPGHHDQEGEDDPRQRNHQNCARLDQGPDPRRPSGAAPGREHEHQLPGERIEVPVRARRV